MTLKNVLIFGDSYSTFTDYIPAGYECYYYKGGRPTITDVCEVTETWWHQLLTETDSHLVLNDSWSGSTICYTGYKNTDCSETSCFICRLNKLIASNFFAENKINTVFVFGGTNDNWANSPLGTMKYSDWKKEDLYSVLPAICFFLSRLKQVLPDARIVCIVNSNLKEEITNGFKEACAHYDIQCIALHDIDKNLAHPTVKGMAQIKEQVLNALR